MLAVGPAVTEPISAIGTADKTVLEALAQLAANAALQLNQQAPDIAATQAHDMANQVFSQAGQTVQTNSEQMGPNANWHESLSDSTQNLRQLAQTVSGQATQTALSAANADGMNQSLPLLNGAPSAAAMRSPDVPVVPVLVTGLQVPVDNRVNQRAAKPATDRPTSYKRLYREREDNQGHNSQSGEEQGKDESGYLNAASAEDAIPLALNSRRTVNAERSDALYLRVLATLRQYNCPASQACLLDLQRGRKTLVALPSVDADGLQSSALACLLWRDRDVGRVACFDARLIWTSARRTAAWIGVRTHKDCDALGQRILKTLPGAGDEMSGAVFFSAEQLSRVRWRDAALVVGEAARLWAMLGHQWSVRIAISTVPLETWQEQTQ
jgi:hypothetical protein